jgi:manganese efflux pump family protein
LHLNLWIAVALIGAQAFLAAQLGLRIGSRLNDRLRGGAERLAGAALLELATLILVERL